MPGPFVPNDSLVGPISSEIATLIQAQIPSIDYIYQRLPDRPPGDNSVTLFMVRGKVLGDTNGKVKIRLTFRMNHLFRRVNISDSFARAYTYVMPWLDFLSAWPNQNLNGLAIEVDATDVGITQVPQSGQPAVALVVDFNVLTEFNIPLT
jgi:hypothetical protein